jgi:hypothetical protein
VASFGRNSLARLNAVQAAWRLAASPTADQTWEVICMSTNLDWNLPDMGQPLLEQIFELWLRPELERRGLDKQPEEVVRALVISPQAANHRF